MTRKRPRILFLTTRFPFPLDRGDHVRAHHLVREFSRVAEVTLVAFTEDSVDREALIELGKYCESMRFVRLTRWRSIVNVAVGLMRPVPLQVSYYRSADMSRVMDELALQRWDLAYALMIRMLPYLDRLNGGVRVLDFLDSMSLRCRRASESTPFLRSLLYREELRRVIHYERFAMARITEGWLAAEPDRRDLTSRFPGARLETIPIGVSTDWGLAGLDGPKEDEALFVGNMTVQHNRDVARYLAREIWPRVRERRPGAVLRLVGRLGATRGELSRSPGVRLEGYVPDLAPLLRRARLAVSPLRWGSGLQTKVIEAMAAGLPLVVTSIVNAAIEARPGESILVSDTTEGLVTSIVRLLENPAQARSVGKAGSEWVNSRFTWATASARIALLLPPDTTPGEEAAL